MSTSKTQSGPSFQRDWTRHHGNVPPLAHLLRSVPGKPWVRFHSLKGSKRYPDGEVERLEIFHLANLLADEVLGDDRNCWLVQCRIEEFAKPKWRPLGFEPTDNLRFADPDDDFHWLVAATSVKWGNGRFEALIESVALDQTGPTLWMNRKDGAIFAPYDGGVDLFPKSDGKVARLKQLYSAWLSSDPSGL